MDTVTPSQQTSTQKPETSEGLFITFEGIDGCGKSTQLNHLATYLESLGHTVCVTRNPGGSEFGKALRAILLHSKCYVPSFSETLLFIADRTEHMETVVLPALKKGHIVLCDRHLDSTVAYQGYGRGLDIDLIHQLNHQAIQGRTPDLTFLFDGDPTLLSQRVQNRGEADRLEAETLSFFERTRHGFLEIASSNPERVKKLDATKNIKSLQKDVLELLEPFLPKHTDS